MATRRHNFHDDDSDSFNLELELQKLRSINSHRSNSADQDTFYYLAGSKKHFQDGKGNLKLNSTDNIDKDQQCKIRNQMLLAKIQQLEVNLSSESRMRQNKLETMKREYETLLRKYRPGSLSGFNVNFDTSTFSGSDSTRNPLKQVNLTSTGVNTILTGPVRPIQPEDVPENVPSNNFQEAVLKERFPIHQNDQFPMIAATNLDQNQKQDKMLLSTVFLSSNTALMPNGSNNNSLLTARNLVHLDSRPPTILTPSSFDPYQKNTQEPVNLARFSEDYERPGIERKQDDNEANYKRKSSLLEELSTTTTTTTSEPILENKINPIIPKPRKSNLVLLHALTDEEEENDDTTTSFSIAKQKVEKSDAVDPAKSLPYNLSQAEEDSSLNSSSSSTTTTISSYDLLKKANLKSGVNLLQDASKPLKATETALQSLSSLMISDGPGTQTLDQVIKDDAEEGEDEQDENEKYNIKESAGNYVNGKRNSNAINAAIGEDDTQNSFVGESLLMDSIHNKTPDSLPRDDSELINIKEDEEEVEEQEVSIENVLESDDQDEDEEEEEMKFEQGREDGESREQFEGTLINDNKEKFTVGDKKVQPCNLSSPAPAARFGMDLVEEGIGNSEETSEKEKEVSSTGTLFTMELQHQKKELGDIQLLLKDEPAGSITQFGGIKPNENREIERRIDEEMKKTLNLPGDGNEFQTSNVIQEDNNEDVNKSSSTSLFSIVPDRKVSITKSGDLISNRHIRLKLDYEDSDSEEKEQVGTEKKYTTGNATRNVQPQGFVGATGDNEILTESDLAKMVDDDFDDFFD